MHPNDMSLKIALQNLSRWMHRLQFGQSVLNGCPIQAHQEIKKKEKKIFVRRSSPNLSYIWTWRQPSLNIYNCNYGKAFAFGKMIRFTKSQQFSTSETMKTNKNETVLDDLHINSSFVHASIEVIN